MPEQARKTLGDRKRKLRKKHGWRRRVVFKTAGIKGEVIYRNPDAVPVPKIIGEQGSRIPFSIENVEWISIAEPSRIIGRGGYGIVFKGLVKFKGKPSAQAVAIKKIHPSISAWNQNPDYPEVISRLMKSKASFPKMAFLKSNNQQYIIQEPFVRQRGSKFFTLAAANTYRLARLDLNTPENQELFKRFAGQAAHLAKAGLFIESAQNTLNQPMIDVFAAFRLKNREVKILVQDIDNLQIEKNPLNAWKNSCEAFKLVLGSISPQNVETGHRILAEIGKINGLQK